MNKCSRKLVPVSKTRSRQNENLTTLIRKNEPQDPIAMLRGRLEFFGAVLTSPAQMSTSQGAANLDIVSGEKIEKLPAAAREESLCE